MKKIIILVFSLNTVFGLQAQLSNELKLSSGPYTPAENLSTYLNRPIVDADEVVAGQYYRLIQFENIPNSEQITHLQEQGLTLLQYIPNKAYLVAMEESFEISSLRDFGVRHISKIPDLLKISEELVFESYPPHILKGDQLELLISYPESIDQTFILAYLESIGVTATEYNGYDQTIQVLAPKSRLAELYDTPFLFRVEPGPPPSIPDDLGGKTLARANLLDSHLPSGRHYDGTGIAVLCRDDGDVGPHIDFTGRLNQEIEGSPLATHADLVSGVMCGAANLNPEIQGMATEVKLFVINYRANFLDNTMDLHFDENVLVTNSSYSNGCNAGYTNTTRTVDDQCFDNATLMHVFSAGNSNGESCGYGAGDQWANITGGHKQGKNVIAVGSTTNTTGIAASSSRGPAYDGRIKPDITAHGQSLTSTTSNNRYATTSGTSFSAPLVAGVMAMLHQAYQDNNNQEIADAALLKTLMLNTANDLGNKGPDFIFGWGSVNAYRAALAIEQKKYELSEVSNGAIVEHTLSIPPGTKETRVMVYWKDPASQPGVSQALINDLDTKIVGPDGTDHFPYVLNSDPDPSSLRMDATTGIDGLNNMEQIAIADPTAGEYLLEVTGSVIPFGVKEYFLTWEHISDEFYLTYPIGGEQLQPGTVLRVHWDAVPSDETYSVEYSLDNGSVWTTVSGTSTRLYKEFALPSVRTNQALIKVRRGNQEVISQAFTIAEVPRQLEISAVCFDNLNLTWGRTDDATSYDIYKLGDKRMEFLTSIVDTFYTASIENSFEREWFAVSANYDDNIKSQRSIAIGSGGIGLENCKLDKDLTVSSINLTNDGNYILCEGPLLENISIDIINDGLEPLNNFEVLYQVNGMTIASENIQLTIQPEDTLVHTFNVPFEFAENTAYDIVVWLERDGERLTQNDTLDMQVQAYFENGENLPFRETFSGSNIELPDFWYSDSEDAVSWGIVPAVEINGQLSNVCVMPFETNTLRGSEDFLNVIPLDFSQASEDLTLTFDLAYDYSNRSDGLLIRILSDCGMTVLDTIYEKYGEELDSSFESFDEPEEQGDWMSQSVDLRPYAGLSKIIIQFVGINQNGSDLFLDNINVTESNIELPEADFNLIANNQTCVLEEIFVSNTSTGKILSESWSFGFGGIPSSSNQNGPHSLSYLFAGEKNVTLTVENELGSSTKVIPLMILDKPSGGWTAEELSAARVQFTSNFDVVSFYSWDFGDGNFSNESSPIHQYAQPGSYEVRLTVRNNCGQKVLIDDIDVITSSVKETDTIESGIVVFPNPNNGTFSLKNTSSSGRPVYELRNSEGMVISVLPDINKSETSFSVPYLESGIYFLTVQSEAKSEMLKIVVVK